MSKPKKGKPVVVCTDKRGVFFGYLDGDPKADPLELKDARMCVCWSTETKGTLGLAGIGPQKGSRVGPAAPVAILKGITAVLECSPEAVKVWESGPWS